MKTKIKICIINNGQFSWILQVDNKTILFQGSENANYFEKLYKKLGYEVKRISTHHN